MTDPSDNQPSSPTMEDDDDGAFPCKGCGNVLQEGKAFELAGNRWHIDCFRCNTCAMLLDSEANLLLLGDGSLICNNCTYSCTACGNKIEDLAILTGEQAFCAGCFRCRNCKRKIDNLDNLRYARTSQGIFCMDCHETLMARRRKRNKAQNQQKTPTLGSNTASPMLALDKSLPSLPPMEVEDDTRSEAQSETPTEVSPQQRSAGPTRSTPGHNADQLSPMGFPNSDHNLRTPRSNKRHSHVSLASETFGEPQLNNGPYEPYTSFIPVVLDPSPGPEPVPLPSTWYKPGKERESQYSHEPQYQFNGGMGEGQYTGSRPVYERNLSDASSSYEHDHGPRQQITSHMKTRHSMIATDRMDLGRRSYEFDQERKGQRQPVDSPAYNNSPYLSSKEPPRSLRSDTPADQPKSTFVSTDVLNSPDNKEKIENFKLGEVPRERKKSLGAFKDFDMGGDSKQSHEHLYPAMRTDLSPGIYNPSMLPPRGDSFGPPPIPMRNDPAASVNKGLHESPVNSAYSSGRSHRSYGASGSGSSAITNDSPEGNDSRYQGLTSSTKTTVSNITYQDSPSKNSSIPPLSRTANQKRPSTAHLTSSLNFSPPQPEAAQPTPHSGTSPVLPPAFKSPVSDLSLDEDIARVFGAGGDSASLLRRVSSAARHGRSFSDLATRPSQSPNWPRSPSMGSGGSAFITFNGQDTGNSESPEGKDENAALRQELRRSTQKIADLEARLNNNASAKALDTNIQEKRNTVALLETEREAFLRELMVIKERMDATKGGKSINMDELKTDLIRGLTRELEGLKSSLKSEIQELVSLREHLAEEVENLDRLRDQSIRETEQLNMKNAQLADLNNELTRRIQGQFQANKSQVSGLGIYTGNSGDLLDIKEHTSRPPTTATSGSFSSMSTPVPMEQPIESSEVFVAQKVTTLKNGLGPKKTFWKKGGVSIMKGAGKGFNKVFASEAQKEGTPYEQMNGIESSPHVPRLGSAAPETPGTKLFAAQKKRMRTKAGINGSNGTVSGSVAGEVVTVPLFGSDLELRADFEGNRVPNVVLKCIQEVEVRGMDFEGIYRKSGGASQMRHIQDMFERGEDPQFDNTTDICGITSVLKQYFRNLPNPLLTYEIYERFVETTTIFDEGKRVNVVKELIDELPSIHRDCLQFVVFHLARVAARQKENLMNTRNLAVVFAPTLLRHTSDEREMSDMHAKNNAIQFLIDNNESIF